jgi:hypothetical protein
MCIAARHSLERCIPSHGVAFTTRHTHTQPMGDESEFPLRCETCTVSELGGVPTVEQTFMWRGVNYCEKMLQDTSALCAVCCAM